MSADENRGEAPPRPLGEILAGVRASLLRFVVVGAHEADAITLWIAHTHAIDAADVTPYLAVTSVEKRCGKTRLLEVLEVLVANPWRTAHTTTAALVRKVDADSPTLLLDESDAAFNGDKEYAQALRGVLNSGYERGGKHSVCVGQGANFNVRDFATFSPKVIAGIGSLPDTVMDRSIPIRLRRAAPGERSEQFRRRTSTPELRTLRDELAELVASVLEQLVGAEPVCPGELSDRAADVWEPLVAIAEAAGGAWPSAARAAAIALSAETVGHAESFATRLLAAIRVAFEADDRLSTATLLSRLAEDESAPWAEWSDPATGQPAKGSARRLATTLTPFGVPKPRTVDGTHRGYLREWFSDPWSRYLPPPSAPTPGTSAESANSAQPCDTHPAPNPPISEIRARDATEPTQLRQDYPADLADLAIRLDRPQRAAPATL